MTSIFPTTFSALLSNSWKNAFSINGYSMFLGMVRPYRDGESGYRHSFAYICRQGTNSFGKARRGTAWSRCAPDYTPVSETSKAAWVGDVEMNRVNVVPETYLVGDCAVGGGTLANAVKMGFSIAMEI